MNGRAGASEIQTSPCSHSNHKKLITAMKVQRNQRYENDKTAEEKCLFLKNLV